MTRLLSLLLSAALCKCVAVLNAIVITIVAVIVVHCTNAPVVAQGKLLQADRQQDSTALVGTAACLRFCCIMLMQCGNGVAGETEILQAGQHMQTAQLGDPIACQIESPQACEAC